MGRYDRLHVPRLGFPLTRQNLLTNLLAMQAMPPKKHRSFTTDARVCRQGQGFESHHLDGWKETTSDTLWYLARAIVPTMYLGLNYMAKIKGKTTTTRDTLNPFRRIMILGDNPLLASIRPSRTKSAK